MTSKTIIGDCLGYHAGGVKTSDLATRPVELGGDTYVHADGKWWNCHRLTFGNWKQAQDAGETVFGLRWDLRDDEQETIERLEALRRGKR